MFEQWIESDLSGRINPYWLGYSTKMAIKIHLLYTTRCNMQFFAVALELKLPT
jgi:hypothetical protein